MKEQMTYIAIDADNVGEQFGSAVLQDDTEQLSQLSQNVNAGVSIFSQWAEYNGGKVISSGSDEAIFQVPTESLEDLEKLKEEYQQKTGFTISIGMGAKVSEAAKALIYAKVNGKDRIIDYSPEIERTMQESISGNVTDSVDAEQAGQEDVPEHEKDLSEEEKQMHDSTEEMSDEEEIEQEEYAEEGMEEEESAPESTDEEDTEEIPVPEDQVDGDYGSEEMEDAQPEHEKEMSEEDEFVHDAEENREDELDEDIVEADEEEAEIFEEEPVAEEEFLEEESGEESEEDEALEEMVDTEDPAEEDIDLDGRPDVQEEHGEIYPEDDLDDDGDVEHEEAMAAESEEEEYTDQEDYGDEYLEDEDLDGAIATEMGEESEEEFAEESQEELGEESGDIIRQSVYESLQSFRQNKQYLDAMGQENPELYNSLIIALQAMIEMAKELGYGPGEGVGDMLSEEDEVMSHGIADEEDAESDEEFGAEEDAESEESEEEEIEEEEETEDEDENEFFEKSERFVALVKRMNEAIQMMKSKDPESLEELKEKFKKKLQSKKEGSKSSKQKKASSIKKPSKKKKKSKNTESKDNDGSFCARSHTKMRASGKDCRANEDKNSPLCSARKKFNCRGKNEEKGPVQKSEKLQHFLKKKDEIKKVQELEKGRDGTATKQTTRHVTKPHNPEGTQKGYKVKVLDNEDGKAQWIDGSRGLARDPQGDPISPDGPSPVSGKKQKTPEMSRE